MRFLLLPLSCLCLALLPAPALQSAAAPAAKAPAAAPVVRPVWETTLQNFDPAIYDREVEKLITQFEGTTGKRVVPGPKKRVGLKIYTDSGEGLATPKGLTLAVISALKRRGFETSNIFLVGLNQFRLRMAGYLPSLVDGDTPFKGHPLYVLESGRYYDTGWYYTSPLPATFDPAVAEAQTKDVSSSSTLEEDRKSFLATPLFLDADFWINLPVYTDHPVLGVNGSLVNATLWNASNTARFFRSNSSAPAAVAEMSAIPEIRGTWAFTIVSLERYQFIGGPFFNSLYSASEHLLWLSADPVMLDALMLDRINRWRRRSGFQPVSDDIRTLEFAEQLKVGSADTSKVRLIHLGDRE